MPSTPPASTPPPIRLATLFQLRPAGRRWPFAARAAICMGLPVLLGWSAGDVTGGLMATIGAFTALYGSDRPYLNRAAHLAIVAASFTVAVTLGVAAADIPFLAVSTIVAIAMAATFLCNALRVGPPGAYMFALACAAGTAMPMGHLTLAQIALLIAGGGSLAWVASMAGALFTPRGPEKAAVLSAARAIAAFADSIGTEGEDHARHVAAHAMHESWTTLVTHQPAQPRPNGTLSRLRAINRELHLVFTGIMNSRDDAAILSALSEKARTLAGQSMNAEQGANPIDPGHVPLGHHGFRESLRESLRLWSPAAIVALRVGIATAIAGAIGAALDLERAYWTMAAAVLMLHQGFGWVRSLQRGIERMSGTMIGLILAGVILALHPQGLWLVLTLMVIQFIIEMTVIRNYALAVVFITTAALTIAAGGQPVPDVGHMLWVRGVDTAIGCAIGLAVLALSLRHASTARIQQELVNTLDAVKRLLVLVAKGESTTSAARQASRNLQQRTLVLLQTYDISIDATAQHRDAAERAWPAVVATQRLAYRVLATCGALERTGTAVAPDLAQALFGADGEKQVDRALSSFSEAIKAGTKPTPLSPMPQFVSTEMQNLYDSLAHSEHNPAC